MEKLAPQLVSAAVRVRQTPKDTSCTEHLGQLRRDWTAKIHALTSVVDDITDFNDFVLMTGVFNLSFPVVVVVVVEVRRQVMRITSTCFDLTVKRIWMPSLCFLFQFSFSWFRFLHSMYFVQSLQKIIVLFVLVFFSLDAVTSSIK